jgi:ribosomal protein L37AE/L43A
MASPCCPKCSKKHFTRSDAFQLKVSLIYCSHCGNVVGVAPLIFKRSPAGKEMTATYQD